MKQHLLLTGFLGVLLTLNSCAKFLEEKSQDEVIPTTTTDFKELLVGSGYFPAEEPSNFTYLLDDDVNFFLEFDNGIYVGSSTSIQLYPTYTWQPSFVNQDGLGQLVNENPGATAYAKFYQWIKGCNAVLDNIDAAIGTQQERDRIKAEALTVRALYYFRLVNLYGEPYNHNPNALAVPLKLQSGLEEQPLKRATVAEVYNRIVLDLKEAGRLMDPLTRTKKDFRINQPAIHILLSRVYLFMENWTEVINEANKVMEFGSVLLDMPSQVAGTINHSYTNPEIEWVYGGNPQANQVNFAPSMEFISSFDPKDIRLEYAISVQSQGYAIISKLSGAGNLNQNLRTAEAYLNRAEAYAKLNQVTPALKDLNALRRSRIADYSDVTITDQIALINEIRDERRKEFCYENFRWFDLRRYGMPEIQHRYQHDKGEPILIYTLKEKDPMYTLPFPNSLMLRNTELVQNPSATMGERIGQ